MADQKVSMTFSSELSGCLIDLAAVAEKPVQELVEKIMQQVIDEVENIGASKIIEECEGEERIKIDEETLQKVIFG
ncbi:hypothetical protein [Wolbachia endosymbiont of Aedes albopictus]|nr:hypothetical protein [Wolbachia endosymbiont of Aedes albopictus]UVW84531.1 hypothetical protein NHG98_06355 [Wolbachia endosymbiont of Aedes albopictus]